MTDRIEDIARRLAFWHGLKIVREGRTVTDSADSGEWGDSPRTYAHTHWQDYTAAAEYVDELVKGLQEDLRRVVMTWDLPGPMSIVKAMNHAIGIARTRFTGSTPSDTQPAPTSAAAPPPNGAARQSRYVAPDPP